MTGVILNWRRPENVAVIVQQWLASGVVDEAIVFNNRAAEPLAPVGPLADARIVNAAVDNVFGLHARFSAALHARNRCVLIQDDDLLLPAATLDTLGAHWEADPAVIHGLFGRNPRADGGYATSVELREASVEVVLTRALVVDREYIPEYFRHFRRFDLDRGDPPGNGEDIVFSYVVALLSGRRHRVHALPVYALPAPHAVQHLRGHRRHRDRVMRACRAWLAGQEAAPPP
jgi:hypothetical protein